MNRWSPVSDLFPHLTYDEGIMEIESFYDDSNQALPADHTLLDPRVTDDAMFIRDLDEAANRGDIKMHSPEPPSPVNGPLVDLLKELGNVSPPASPAPQPNAPVSSASLAPQVPPAPPAPSPAPQKVSPLPPALPATATAAAPPPPPLPAASSRLDARTAIEPTQLSAKPQEPNKRKQSLFNEMREEEQTAESDEMILDPPVAERTHDVQLSKDTNGDAQRSGTSSWTRLAETAARLKAATAQKEDATEITTRHEKGKARPSASGPETAHPPPTPDKRLPRPIDETIDEHPKTTAKPNGKRALAVADDIAVGTVNGNQISKKLKITNDKPKKEAKSTTEATSAGKAKQEAPAKAQRPPRGPRRAVGNKELQNLLGTDLASQVNEAPKTRAKAGASAPNAGRAARARHQSKNAK